MSALTLEQSYQVASFYGIAVNTANRYRVSGIDFDDLLSACHEAVMKAVQDYDPASEMTLKGYIIKRCRWACIRVINRAKKRLKTSELLNPPTIHDRPFPSLTPSVKDFHAYRALPPRCRKMVAEYLSTGSILTAARRLGVTRQRIQQATARFVLAAQKEVAVCR